MKIVAIAAGVLLGLVSPAGQALSTADIAAAIEQGRAGKTLQKKCGASGENGFDVIVEGPVGRIMRAAQDAKRQQRDFTADDVTSTLSGPWLSVIARRDRTLSAASSAMPMKGANGVWVVPESAAVSTNDYRSLSTSDRTYRASIELKSKPAGAKDPILLRPTGRIIYTQEYRGGTNAADIGPVPGTDMKASFDLDAFRAVPPGDVEVVIFASDAGEQRCKISDKERRAIR